MLTEGGLVAGGRWSPVCDGRRALADGVWCSEGVGRRWLMPQVRGGQRSQAGGWWLVAGGWWLVAGGWWLVAGRHVPDQQAGQASALR